jgi:putative DNA methylase
MANDRRLIEDYLPIQAISAEASREKSVRKGHISTLHLWWARRPLVACRAAVYGALVPADQFQPANGPESKRASLGRANAAKFLKRLCTYPGDSRVIAEAQGHILEAHARRLTQETGKTVTREDIEAGRAPRPKVLDMFAGGGAIPLEALRLGCEAYALDLNPVAYIILLATLVYPQRYGQPDPAARGMTGPPMPDGKPTWGGLAKEVRYWGEWLIKKVKGEIGDLYPLFPDPEYKGKKSQKQLEMWWTGESDQAPLGYLVPVAYLWTRTVKCKNPNCGGIVPLVRQTWLCKKKGRYAALKMITILEKKEVIFEVVEAQKESDLGFDPEAFSKGGNATCPFCGTVADGPYVKTEGCAKRIGQQMMAIICTRKDRQGKSYISVEKGSKLLNGTGMKAIPSENEIIRRIQYFCKSSGTSIPEEVLVEKLTDQLPKFGITKFCDVFNVRQLLCLLTFVGKIKDAFNEINNNEFIIEHSKAITVYLAFVLDRLADWNSSLCSWAPEKTGGAKIGHTFGRQALPMVNAVDLRKNPGYNHA